MTNSGSRGSVLGRPVINLPQAVIVEMDMIQDRVVAHRAADGSISMQQDANLYLAKLKKGESAEFDLGKTRGAWAQMARGSATLDD